MFVLIPLFPLVGAAVNGLLGVRFFSRRAVGAMAVGAAGLGFAAAVAAFAGLLRAADPVSVRTLFTWIPASLVRTASGGTRLAPARPGLPLRLPGRGHDARRHRRGPPDPHLLPRLHGARQELRPFLLLSQPLHRSPCSSSSSGPTWASCSSAGRAWGFAPISSSASGSPRTRPPTPAGRPSSPTGSATSVSCSARASSFTPWGRSISAAIAAAVEAGTLAKGTATAAALLLFLGATGKSAQIPLYTWLPDAMEGPTPVSALIHAATMVTAGVYMVARLHTLFTFSGTALTVVALTGAFTAVYAATMGLVQTDIKRVLAYSTISQIGFMFIGLGVGAYAAGIFHLMTHAFFKSLLFLAAGSVIHALSGEQDMRRMGGLRTRIPRTYRVFLVGALAISGIPGLSGFFSKDEILASAFASGNYLVWALGLAGAAMTAFYMFRLIFLTFEGEARSSDEAARHLHESPPVMLVPLEILAVLADRRRVRRPAPRPRRRGLVRPLPRAERGAPRASPARGDGGPPHGPLGRRRRRRDRRRPGGLRQAEGRAGPPLRREVPRPLPARFQEILRRRGLRKDLRGRRPRARPHRGLDRPASHRRRGRRRRARASAGSRAGPSPSTRGSSTARSTASAKPTSPSRPACAACRPAASTTTPWPSCWASSSSSPSPSPSFKPWRR